MSFIRGSTVYSSMNLWNQFCTCAHGVTELATPASNKVHMVVMFIIVHG